jgi:hypothetical protein
VCIPTAAYSPSLIAGEPSGDGVGDAASDKDRCDGVGEDIGDAVELSNSATPPPPPPPPLPPIIASKSMAALASTGFCGRDLERCILL